MSIVAITGNHPRHAYLVAELARTGQLAGWVREIREEFVPTAPPGLAPATAKLFDLHFARREEAEATIFGTPDTSAIETLDIPREELNSERVATFITARSPALVLSYGCHKLSADLRAAVGATFWNTHGGLSPQYRGVITHFWPSYMLEPQMTGVTLHETTDALDGGAVIHQTGAVMERGDGVHMLAARTVKGYADALGPLLAQALEAGPLPRGAPQRSTGKLWLSRDWRPEHLHLVYETYGDRIVDHVLDGRLEGATPDLVSVLA